MCFHSNSHSNTFSNCQACIYIMSVHSVLCGHFCFCCCCLVRDQNVSNHRLLFAVFVMQGTEQLLSSQHFSFSACRRSLIICGCTECICSPKTYPTKSNILSPFRVCRHDSFPMPNLPDIHCCRFCAAQTCTYTHTHASRARKHHAFG